MAIAKRDLGRIYTHEPSLDRVHTDIQTMETNIASLLSGGTTNTSQVHHVDGASTANVANLAAFTVANDGVTHVEGNRVLLKNQSSADENGIYVVGAVATGTAPLTRATDFDAAAEVKANTIVAVRAGTVNANTLWVLGVATAVVVGTTNLPFVQLFTATQLAVQGTSSAGATKLGIYDVGSIITATTVDGALTEIKTQQATNVSNISTNTTNISTNATKIATGNGITARSPVRRVRGVTAANMASFTGVSETFDGLTLVENDRILVAYQSTPAENGIYVVGAVAGGVADWSRASDMAAAAVVPNGTIIVVDAGTVGANTIYKLTNAGTITIATTGLTFERIYTSTELAVQGSATAGATLMGIYDNGGLITATTVDGALTEIKGLVDTNTAAIFAKRTVQVQHGDLTNAVNGAADTINVGTALPANAVVVAAEVNIATLFSGGGATAVKLDLGGTDIDAIGAQHDVFTGAATGALTLNPAGVHVAGKFSSEQLVATFTPDGAHTLAGLDAGDLTITVWYHVLA